METINQTSITVSTTVQVPVEKVWQLWNEPQHITQWCQASEDWHAPSAENDLRPGGRLTTRMEAKDGSFGFDFGGTYSVVDQYRTIEYSLDDGRRVKVEFSSEGDATSIVETFDAEKQNPADMQKAGWQAILDSFKRYAESVG